MKIRNEDAVLKEVRKTGKRIEALRNRSMTRQGAIKVASEEKGFVVREKNGKWLPCRWAS